MDRTASNTAASGAAKPKGQRAAELALSLPNILTYFRIAMVPAVVGCLFFLSTPTARWAALGVYLIACITDWFDGYLARAWQQQSALGRMLDPIADKLLVGATLLILTHDNTINGVHIWAAVIILCREILVSGLREFLAELNVKIHVTRLAKWKTTLQMVALAVLLAGPAADIYVPYVTTTGLFLLWVAALLTLLTGYDYLRAAVRHAMTD
jgi:cardiolipin synthase